MSSGDRSDLYGVSGNDNVIARTSKRYGLYVEFREIINALRKWLPVESRNGKRIRVEFVAVDALPCYVEPFNFLEERIFRD